MAKLKNREQKCVEPVAGEQVYDYYNGALSAAEISRFERHLVKCFYCERLILELDLSLAALNDEQDFGLVVKSNRRPKRPRSPPFHS